MAPESWKTYYLGGESPPIRVLLQLVKTNLGHYREVLSEGDAENRESRSRIYRPKSKSVKRGGRISWRTCDNNGKSST
jgi:hypothetical protein